MFSKDSFDFYSKSWNFYSSSLEVVPKFFLTLWLIKCYQWSIKYATEDKLRFPAKEYNSKLLNRTLCLMTSTLNLKLLRVKISMNAKSFRSISWMNKGFVSSCLSSWWRKKYFKLKLPLKLLFWILFWM